MRIGGKLLESLNASTSKTNEQSEKNGLFNEIFNEKQINTSIESTTTNNVYANLKTKARKKDESEKFEDDSNVMKKDKSVGKKDKTESKKSDKTSKSKETKKVSDEEVDDEKIKEVYDKIANFLGINVEELQTLITEKGIDPQSLTTLEGVRNAIVELTGLSDASELLNLEGIKDLFTSIDETLNTPDDVFAERIMAALADENNSEVVENDVVPTEHLQKTDDTEAVVENVSEEDSVAQNTVSKTQTTTNAENVRANANDTVENDLNETVETVGVAEQAVATKVVDEKNTETGHNNRVLEVMEEINQQQVNTVQATSQSSTGQNGQSSQSGNSQGNTQNTANTNENVMNNIMFTQDAKSQATTFGTIVNNKMNQPMNQTEVINQIIERMKVSINGDTSEVRITLRPEHLGDVTLKIATHNGIVTAEFLAENEQVKALIESNFSDLQDTLRQQGIEVSDFTTGLLSDQSNGNQRNNNNRGQRSNNNGLVDGEEIVEEVVQDNEIKISNYDFRA